MSSGWIYWRRPSLSVRYRHGGETAIYTHYQTNIGTQREAQKIVGDKPEYLKIAFQKEDNILDFSSASRRTEHTHLCRNTRSGGNIKR